MAEVKLVNVSKIYSGKNKAVDNVNLEMKDKEFVVLVGPSGCGKSTTLRMIAGLEDVTEGEIYIDNTLVNDITPKNRDIAMVFQNYALYPHMTVYENMAFGLKLRKFKKQDIKERVIYAAKILGLEDYLDRKPKALSGGQRQRVAVGRAIVRKPKVFLFDEPLSNLDAKLRVQMRTEISKLHRKLNATMVYVTHDQTEAMTMGDTIVIMKDGLVQQIDTPLNLYNDPTNKFVAGFIGSPSINFIEGNISSGNGLKFISTKGELSIQLLPSQEETVKDYVNKSIIIGIRPEDIHLINETSEANLSNFMTQVEIVEPMGNEIMLYFNIENKQMVSRVSANISVKAGEEVNLVIDISKLHFFNPENGLALK